MNYRSSTNAFPFAVTGHSILSPVGINVEMTCASIRAGIARYEQHPYYHAAVEDIEVDELELVMGGFVPGLDEYQESPDRLYAIAMDTLQGLIENAKLRRAELTECALCVGLLQKSKACEEWQLEKEFVPTLLNKAGLEGFKKTVVVQDGGCSMLNALQKVNKLMSTKEATSCIVLGVDSYMDPLRLEELDEDYRLKSQRGVDGFVPAEAGCALLIESERSMQKTRRRALAHLSRVSTGVEPRHQGSERYSSGKGLSMAVSGALRSLPKGHTIQWVLCDLNGESYRSGDWGMVLGRMPKELGAITTLEHPKDCIGEVGAAIGGILVSYVIHSFERQYAPKDTALVWTAADDGKRSALLVKKPD